MHLDYAVYRKSCTFLPFNICQNTVLYSIGELSFACRSRTSLWNDLSQSAVTAPAASATFMIEGRMLKTRMKRVVDRGDHAVRRLGEIEASIANLSNEDLLDLADIFKAKPCPPIGDMAVSEMARRNINL